MVIGVRSVNDTINIIVQVGAFESFKELYLFQSENRIGNMDSTFTSCRIMKAVDDDESENNIGEDDNHFFFPFDCQN